MSSWQVISSADAYGFLVCVNELIVVQNKIYSKPTVIIASKVTGAEEIPAGVVAVLTPCMIDVLSHVSIRARNSKECTIFCSNMCHQTKLQIEEPGSLPFIRKLIYLLLILRSSDADMLCHMLRSECSRQSEVEGRESNIYSYKVYWFSYQVIELLCCHCSLR